MFFLLLLILPGVRSQDPTTSYTSYTPRQLAFNSVQFVQHKPAKKGPILFPNDAPPPPPTPLIVTSRPLAESIARSELNPNNSLPAPSEYHQVTFKPNYLARGKNYEPYSYNLATVTPVYDYDAYADTARGQGSKVLFEDREKSLYEYNNVQQQYNTAPQAAHYKYKESPVQYYRSNTNADDYDYNKENNHGDNYAFSYTVKDHKTGDDFSHSQKSTGSATNGEYRVRLPDGRMQIVSYTADENGYKADVRYDEDDKENSIDFDKDKDKDYQNNNLRATYNQNLANTYIQRPQQIIQQIPYNPKNYKRIDDTHDYENNDNFQYQSTVKPNNGYQFVYPTKSVYVDTTRATINDGLSDTNNDYLDNYNSKLESSDKLESAHDDYKFSDEVDFTKEDTLDYSSELDNAYQPHKSKFSAFANQNVQSSVRPSYDELKDLFVTNVNGRRNAVVSTERPLFTVTPENVVAITPKKPNLYTSIKNIATATAAPFFYSTPSPVTPKSYLFSTIANLKQQIKLANKPVLSDHFINKINKYLSYTNPSKIDG